MCDELFSTVQGSLTDAVFDCTAWTKLLELNGLELTLDPADVRGTTVPFEEFYDNFVDLTSDDVTSSPSVPEGDADTNSADLNSSDNASQVIATSGSDDTETDSSYPKFSRGTRVRKRFRQGWFDGAITSIDMDDRSCDIACSDGDTEDIFFEDPEFELLAQQAKQVYNEESTKTQSRMNPWHAGTHSGQMPVV